MMRFIAALVGIILFVMVFLPRLLVFLFSWL